MHQKKTVFEGHEVAYWVGGEGPPLLMLHGSGPGASTHGNWRLVMEPLSRHFSILATDLVGFGVSGRKTAAPFFDMELWKRQARFLLDLWGVESADVLGHSLSGALSLKLAAADGRIRRVVTTGSLGVRYAVSEAGARVWTFPENEDDLRRTAHMLVHDQGLIDEAYIQGRKKVLFDDPGYRAYFSAMFAGDKQAFADAALLTPDEFACVRQPVMLIHGRDDQPTPMATSIELAERLQNADLVLLDKCGHSVALEHPEKLVSLIRAFLMAPCPR